jgi:outer membrane protein
MKNSKILSILLIITALFSVQAQDDSSNAHSKWQMRLRGIVVSPNAGDNLDGATVGISTAVVPELDFTYFFSENIAAELILGTTKHNVEVEESSTDLGHVWLLPPTLTLQYHFSSEGVKPYLGAGLNYTIFYGVDAGDAAGMEYDNSVGFAVQGGLDFPISDKWFLNLDVKYIGLGTDVNVDLGDAQLPVEVDINPLIIGLGVGTRF